MKILDEKYVLKNINYHELFSVVENYVNDYIKNKTVLFPRNILNLRETSLTFNYGECNKNKVFGYRVYAGDLNGKKNTDHLTVVYNQANGEVKGIVKGETIGALKTALTTALAIKKIYKKPVQHLGIIGSGIQAEYHIKCITKILGADCIYHFSKSKANAARFVKKLKRGEELNILECSSSWDVIKKSQVVVTATDSAEPLWSFKIFPDNLQLLCHIGSKYSGASEIPFYYYKKAQGWYTDSPEQLKSNVFRLSEIGKIIQLFKHFSYAPIPKKHSYSIYLSQGISGLDVVLSDFFLKKNDNVKTI